MVMSAARVILICWGELIGFIDAAANPSVLAGVTDDSSSRQLLEHNLVGTINLLDTVRELVQVW